MSLISLAKYRAKKQKLELPSMVMACLKCEGQIFKIAHDGRVFCVTPQCGSVMTNLKVSLEDVVA